MSKVLSNLEPKKVFHYFEEISSIPRGSRNEKQISDYLYKFAKDRGLEVVQDPALNIIIKKNATVGYKNAPTIILQCHMDMVCEKNSDVVHNFKKDPISLRINGDYIKATGTTLGADNGIGVAYALAILDDDNIKHPNLEVVITTDEETGMSGAKAIDSSLLNGNTIINLDTENEGEFIVSCAGGMRVDITLLCHYAQRQDSQVQYSIKICGLLGGHSGIDIGLNRANANILLGRLLNKIWQVLDFEIVNISGGAQFNAIPRESEVLININEDNAQKLKDIIKSFEDTLCKEYFDFEQGLSIKVQEELDIKKISFNHETTTQLIQLLTIPPNGVQSMSNDIEGLVESSLNLGVISTLDNQIVLSYLIRSSVKDKEDIIYNKLKTAAILIGGNIEVINQYPGLEYNIDSKIINHCKKVYNKLYGKEPTITAIHAGLEGGIFKEKIEDVDFISFGATMHNAHSPKEELSISSTSRIWEFLKAVLEDTVNIK